MLGSNYLTDNLYCDFNSANVRLEENLIMRIIEQYKATKIKLNQVLIYNASLTPATRMSDNYMINRKFALSGGEIDFEADSFSVKMIESCELLSKLYLCLISNNSK